MRYNEIVEQSDEGEMGVQSGGNGICPYSPLLSFVPFLTSQLS